MPSNTGVGVGIGAAVGVGIAVGAGTDVGVGASVRMVAAVGVGAGGVASGRKAVARGSGAAAARKDAAGKITEVNYRGSSGVGVEELGSGFSVTTDIPGENTGAAGAIGLVKDSRTGGDLFGNLISLRDNLFASEKEAIVERDIPALRKDAEHLIQHFGEVSANQMMLDTVVALAADIQTEGGQSMSTVDKLGNIQYALHRATVDNRNFIQQDPLRPVN